MLTIEPICFMPSNSGIEGVSASNSKAIRLFTVVNIPKISLILADRFNSSQRHCINQEPELGSVQLQYPAKLIIIYAVSLWKKIKCNLNYLFI